MKQLFARIRRHEGGAAVTELGLAIPMLFILLLGLIDLGRGFSIKLQLEQAAQRAIERVMNGQADRTTVAALKAEAAVAADVPETAGNPTVDFWLECNGVRQANYDATCGTGQVFRRYLSVRIEKTFTPIFSMAGTNDDGTITIRGATSVRTQ